MNRDKKKLTKNWTHPQFYERNPFKYDPDQKKNNQKIELTFSFTKEIPLKIIRNKKKSTLKFGLKNTL